jgi:hypothetical protein
VVARSLGDASWQLLPDADARLIGREPRSCVANTRALSLRLPTWSRRIKPAVFIAKSEVGKHQDRPRAWRRQRKVCPTCRLRLVSVRGITEGDRSGGSATTAETSLYILLSEDSGKIRTKQVFEKSDLSLTRPPLRPNVLARAPQMPGGLLANHLRARLEAPPSVY